MLRNQKSKLTKIAARAFVTVFLTLPVGNLSAQGDRRLIEHPSPVYPETAKRFSITGVVKVQVVIAPDGHIKETKVLGGHPMLVEAVQEALKNWKYAPTNSETTTVLEFRFHP